jgi:hypothetical protein
MMAARVQPDAATTAATPDAAAPVAPRRGHPAAAVLAYVVVAAVLAYRTAGELNVLGDPLAPRFGLADFRDGVYFPVVSFLAGHNPYDPSVHLATYPVYYPFPLYSPALFLLHLPFGLLPFATASWLYFALTVVGVVLIADLTLRLCDMTVTPTRRFALAALILASRPGHWSVFVGQFAVTLTLATYVALYWVRRRPWLAAAALAVSTIKPTFAIPLAILLAARGEWRVVGRGVVLAAALTAVPTAMLIQRAGGVGAFADVLTRSHAAFAAEAAVDPSRSLYRVDTPAIVGRVLGSATGGLADLVIGAAILALAATAVRRLAGDRSPAAARLASVIICLAVLAWSYHQAYDEILLAMPLVAAAAGRWALPDAAVGWVRWTLVALLGASAINYLASENAALALGISGGWWTAVASLNSVAVIVSLVLSVFVALRLTARADVSAPVGVGEKC